MGKIDTSFEDTLLAAIDEKTDWFNRNVLQQMQDNYRLHLTCVTNIISTLVKKSLVNDDPYKHDKKISDIVPPSDAEFAETDRANMLGTRLSDYESMVDFICNYYNFTVEAITLDKIKKMNELNNTFNWDSLVPNAPKQNTRALCGVITELKNSGDSLTINLMNDNLSKAKSSIKAVALSLRQVADFQREVFKAKIRREILRNPQCNREKAYESPEAFIAEVKRLFPSLIGKKPYYSDLIDELIKEEIGSETEKRRADLMNKLKIAVPAAQKKKEIKIDTREMIMEATRVLGTTNEQLSAIYEKFHNNYELLESTDVTLGQKIARFFRNMLGLKDPPVDYEVIVHDTVTGVQHKELIHFVQFMENLKKRSELYLSFSTKISAGYSKMLSKDEEQILKFLNKNLGEMNTIFEQMTALDVFFKESAPFEIKSKIKGIKMELTTLKNILIKANQLRAEYTSYIEEREQMKKLGIIE